MGNYPFVQNTALTNPMTNSGDLIDGGVAGTPQRLGIGTGGQVLTVSTGAPTWLPSASGFTNPMTTAGDMIDATTGGAAQRLAVGSNGQVLTVVTGAPAWAPAASGGTAGGVLSGTYPNPGFAIPALLSSGSGTTVVLETEVTGNTNPTFSVNAGGTVAFGSGTGATDTDLYRSAAATLKTDNSLVVGTNLTVAGQTEVAAGTTSLTPLLFQSGTLNTSATAGAAEYDGTCFYATAAASSRQVLGAEQIQVLSSGNTLANNTSAQAIFNATAAGALTVQASTTYEFECVLIVTGLSASSHTISFGIAGTAGFTSLGYLALTGAAGTLALINSATAAATTIIAANTNTTGFARIRGILRINATGGTIIPQITQGTNSAAASVNANSFFRAWPIGSNTVTNVGDWS